MANPEVEKIRRVLYLDSDIGKNLEAIKGYYCAYRKIPFVGKIEEEYIQQVALLMAVMDYESNNRITLLMNSGGGSVDYGFQLGDAINSLNSPVDAIAFGDNASMAVDVLQMCAKRYLLPNTRLLIHYVRHSKEFIGDDEKLFATDIDLVRQHMAEYREKRLRLYERRTKMRRKKLQELFRFGEIHHEYISAEQAVRLGLADKILTDFKLFRGRHYKKTSRK